MMRKIVLCILTFLFSSNISLANIAILPSFADIIEPLIPAVVNVYTTQYKKQKREPSRIVPPGFPFDQFNELFERFEIPLEAEDMPVAPRTSLGSGFVIDAEGYIVTNHHVIDNADEIYIKLGGGKEIKAKLIGSDQRTDLALLKIDSKEQLPFVKFGSSSEARVGD
ncbi:MAG: trypsin-like peptidase domain-containing protein, partial [Pseudomonadota bacterium]